MTKQEVSRVADELCGSVDRIVFRNETNGWTVMDLETEADGVQKVVGELPMVSVGETLRLQGQWVEHATFGRQFRASMCERYLPTDTTAIYRYLASGTIKGIGPALAMKIVQTFGDGALTVMEKEPRRLAQISGISPKKAETIGEEFAAQFGLREVMLAFSNYGLTPSEAVRCFKKWGMKTVDTVKDNPYVLCGGGLRIGFERADAIARELHCPPDDPRRVAAGLQFVLRHNTGNGHTCLPQGKLVATTAAMLEADVDGVEKQLYELERALELKRMDIDGETLWFLPMMHRAETYIASRLATMAALPPTKKDDVDARILALEKNHRILYEDAQKEAILQALERGVLILTGGPGTGKTTTLSGIIALLESYGETVLLAAPTGRAANRIAELTGREAKTIHRLLEVQWDNSDEPVFARHEKNPLDAEAVVIDELSMVDTLLFESLLRAMPSGCRLIMVGDCDQLPAVGAGRVLGDLIDSRLLPTVQLTQVFRQAQTSRIVTNAHRIVAGRYPDVHGKDGDFFFISRPDTRQVQQTVGDLCMRRLPDHYGYNLFEGLQVLCPGRKGDLGTIEINRRLQALANPPDSKKPEVTLEGRLLRQGDKVMHTRNNYDITWAKDNGEVGSGVFNGDIGILEEIEPHGQTLKVRYDDRVAIYSKEDAADLEPAYAITVHKSQGSEFDAVVIPLFQQAPQLCYRNLLYTAVTRAKKLIVLVGSIHTMEQMVDNHKKTLRYTGLPYMLKEGESLL
ncbi:MAG: ATP-dependent RecD-like DNA helicase [Clostridia bacterium]|nr:ATP-dependent RecD-like DNA helicase [Clostridia bacterium]